MAHNKFVGTNTEQLIIFQETFRIGERTTFDNIKIMLVVHILTNISLNVFF